MLPGHTSGAGWAGMGPPPTQLNPDRAAEDELLAPCVPALEQEGVNIRGIHIAQPSSTIRPAS
jgi:hypothetical protein